jgi:cyanate permease
MTAGLIGTATGVIAFGRLYDATQSYDLALMIAAVMLLVVVGLYLALAGPMRRPLETVP